MGAERSLAKVSITHGGGDGRSAYITHVRLTHRASHFIATLCLIKHGLAFGVDTLTESNLCHGLCAIQEICLIIEDKRERECSAWGRKKTNSFQERKHILKNTF
jgi:hypothetical protein